MGNSKILKKNRVPHPVDGAHFTEVEVACSTCDGSKVVIVPDIELPKMEASALDDIRCHECEGLSA